MSLWVFNWLLSQVVERRTRQILKTNSLLISKTATGMQAACETVLPSFSPVFPLRRCGFLPQRVISDIGRPQTVRSGHTHCIGWRSSWFDRILKTVKVCRFKINLVALVFRASFLDKSSRYRVRVLCNHDYWRFRSKGSSSLKTAILKFFYGIEITQVTNLSFSIQMNCTHSVCKYIQLKSQSWLSNCSRLG